MPSNERKSKNDMKVGAARQLAQLKSKMKFKKLPIERHPRPFSTEAFEWHRTSLLTPDQLTEPSDDVLWYLEVQKNYFNHVVTGIMENFKPGADPSSQKSEVVPNKDIPQPKNVIKDVPLKIRKVPLKIKNAPLKIKTVTFKNLSKRANKDLRPRNSLNTPNLSEESSISDDEDPCPRNTLKSPEGFITAGFSMYEDDFMQDFKTPADVCAATPKHHLRSQNLPKALFTHSNEDSCSRNSLKSPEGANIALSNYSTDEDAPKQVCAAIFQHPVRSPNVSRELSNSDNKDLNPRNNLKSPIFSDKSFKSDDKDSCPRNRVESPNNLMAEFSMDEDDFLHDLKVPKDVRAATPKFPMRSPNLSTESLHVSEDEGDNVYPINILDDKDDTEITAQFSDDDDVLQPICMEPPLNRSPEVPLNVDDVAHASTSLGDAEDTSSEHSDISVSDDDDIPNPSDNLECIGNKEQATPNVVVQQRPVVTHVFDENQSDLQLDYDEDDDYMIF